MSKTKIVAFFGEAGSGKDYLLKYCMNYFPTEAVNSIVSCTTRQPRSNEKEGIDYWFLNKREFNSKVEDEQMIEYQEFNGWYYGVSKDAIDDDKINFGVFTPWGIAKLMAAGYDVLPIRVHCPDKDRLMRQLVREENPNVNEIIRRYQADRMDFKVNPIEFDYYTIESGYTAGTSLLISLILKFSGEMVKMTAPPSIIPDDRPVAKINLME